jgi:voltage-gated potassium channel
VIVAVDRDDTAVLITLTARQLNADAYVVAAVREAENASLLEQGGANLVITSSAAAGRLLGLGTVAPRAVRLLEDLMSTGEGLDVDERQISPEEAGPLSQIKLRVPVLGVVRDGRILLYDDEEAQELRPGDRVLYVKSHPRESA